MTDVTQILNDTLGDRGYESGKLEVDSSHLLQIAKKDLKKSSLKVIQESSSSVSLMKRKKGGERYD